MITKTAMIAIIGRPNTGKSTLVNTLTGDKVAIVSPKPQTTRNRIFGIFTYKDTQVILLDTPGFHKAMTRLGEYMVNVVKKSVADVDAALLMVEPLNSIGTQEEHLIEHIKKAGIPAVLAVNKTDTVKPESILPVIDIYSKRHDFDTIVPVSAKNGDGIGTLLEQIIKYAKPGPQLFPDGMTTDQPERQVIAEIIREKLLICLDKEVPHGTAVEIAGFSERDRSGSNEGADDDAVIDVSATIYCERKSHKGIIIGKNGVMLKRIGRMARLDIERFMGAAINLQTWVKVKENWRESGAALRNFGYAE